MPSEGKIQILTPKYISAAMAEEYGLSWVGVHGRQPISGQRQYNPFLRETPPLNRGSDRPLMLQTETLTPAEILLACRP